MPNNLLFFAGKLLL